jgi:hypothetical protein
MRTILAAATATTCRSRSWLVARALPDDLRGESPASLHQERRESIAVDVGCPPCISWVVTHPPTIDEGCPSRRAGAGVDLNEELLAGVAAVGGRVVHRTHAHKGIDRGRRSMSKGAQCAGVGPSKGSTHPGAAPSGRHAACCRRQPGQPGHHPCRDHRRLRRRRLPARPHTPARPVTETESPPTRCSSGLAEPDDHRSNGAFPLTVRFLAWGTLARVPSA